jgi:hypothetical protein
MKAPAPALSLILNSISILAEGTLIVRRLAIMPSAAGHTKTKAAQSFEAALAKVCPDPTILPEDFSEWAIQQEGALRVNRAVRFDYTRTHLINT